MTEQEEEFGTAVFRERRDEVTGLADVSVPGSEPEALQPGTHSLAITRLDVDDVDLRPRRGARLNLAYPRGPKRGQVFTFIHLPAIVSQIPPRCRAATGRGVDAIPARASSGLT
ncbi:MAG: hypothetical protein QM606_10085 [Leucobacter sp.]